MADIGSTGQPLPVPDAVFEEKDLAKLSKSEIEAVIASVLQGVFYVIASSLKQSHWELTNKEAAELAGACWDCVKTLPAKQSKRVDKFLKEYAPWIKLLMVGGSILGSRAAVSLQLEKLKRENEQLRNNANRVNDSSGAGPGTGNVTGFGTIVTDEFIQ